MGDCPGRETDTAREQEVTRLAGSLLETVREMLWEVETLPCRLVILTSARCWEATRSAVTAP